MHVDPLSPEAFTDAYQAQQNQSAADSRLHVTFHTEEFKDEEESAKQGRPIFKSIEMCEIRYGDKDNIIDDRVDAMIPDPRIRFPVQWAKFKAGASSQIEGTLLREWGLMDRSTAKSYEAIGIFTVEQLAALSDTNCSQVRGSMADRQTAKDYLEAAAGHAPLAQARAENASLRAELDALREQVQAISGQAVPMKIRKKPGPKPKVEVEG